MILSRISSKAQTTVPRAVRAALGITEGDQLVWQVEGDRVVLKRAAVVEKADPFDGSFANFEEWADDLDRAYDDL
jgi:antitoxin PrlF